MTHELGLTKELSVSEKIVGNKWVFSDRNLFLTPANYFEHPKELWRLPILKLFSAVNDNYLNPEWNFETLLVSKTEKLKVINLILVYSDPKSNKATKDVLLNPSLVKPECYSGLEGIKSDLLSGSLAGTNYVVYDGTCVYNKVKKTEKISPFSKQTQDVYYTQTGVGYMNLALSTIDRVVEIEESFMNSRRQMLEESFDPKIKQLKDLYSQVVTDPISLF